MAHASRQFVAAGLPASSWRVTLEGSLLAEALKAVDEIAAGLAVLRADKPASTLAEVALFYGYLAQAKHDAQMAERALQYLNAAIDKVGRQPLLPWLIGGYPQVGWVIAQLAGKLFDQQETETCQAVDETLLDYLQSLPQPADFDLISGLTGIGVYALARLPEPRALACLQLVVQRLAERAERSQDGATWFTAPELLPAWQRQICPNGYYNLGLAHGVPGVIALLARACAVEPLRLATRPLLEDAVRWLLAHLGEADGAPFFPDWLAPELPSNRSRLAWCYGDLGSATALLYAARCTGQPEWETVALQVLRYAARNRGAETGVLDAGICHGAAGNAHIFNRIYQATDEELFKEAARYWYARAFDFRQPEVGIAGFAAFHPKEAGAGEWVESVDLFNGAAGVGLALLAASSNIMPAWDECLLVSLPPR
jgi:lantibiotic biosynthesis protein